MLSLHLKATMMKISDPIIFGHVVRVYFKAAFEKHAATFASLGINPNNGLAALYEKLQQLPDAQRAEIEADLNKCVAERPVTPRRGRHDVTPRRSRHDGSTVTAAGAYRCLP